jgi:hypothetical protein
MISISSSINEITITRGLLRGLNELIKGVKCLELCLAPNKFSVAVSLGENHTEGWR